MSRAKRTVAVPATEAVATPITEAERKSKTGLPPCPFCNSIELSLLSSGEPPEPITIMCDICGASGPHARMLKELGLFAEATPEQMKESLSQRWATRRETV